MAPARVVVTTDVIIEGEMITVVPGKVVILPGRVVMLPGRVVVTKTSRVDIDSVVNVMVVSEPEIDVVIVSIIALKGQQKRV